MRDAITELQIMAISNMIVRLRKIKDAEQARKPEHEIEHYYEDNLKQYDTE